MEVFIMIFEKIATIIAEQLQIDQSKITLESKVIDDLKADSLDVVELLMALEEEFDISVDEDEAGKLSTVGDIVKLIENNKK